MVVNMPKKYYTRIVENELDQLLGIFGAVLIEGPKWCGKTTTAETRAASRLLLMDRPATSRIACAPRRIRLLPFPASAAAD